MTTKDMDRIADEAGVISAAAYQAEKDRLQMLEELEARVVDLKMEIAEAALEELRRLNAPLRDRQIAGGRIGGLKRGAGKREG